MTLRQQLRTVYIFTKLSTRRFFRDGLAIFFVILFPLIFLFVFGSFNSGSNNVSFKIALLNKSHTKFATSFVQQMEKSQTFKIDKGSTDLAKAKDKMGKSQIDGIIILPVDFGVTKPGQAYPSGQAELLYNHTNSGTGQTLTSVLQGAFDKINAKLVTIQRPFGVAAKELNEKSLTAFDYTF